MRLFSVLLLVITFFTSNVVGFCWGSGVYHLAAEALATGIGPIESAAVCVYGENRALDDDCPLPCQVLLASAWGDCYCRNPQYKPKSFGANSLIKPLSVSEMFDFLSKPSPYAPFATCRSWLIENSDDWLCLN